MFRRGLVAVTAALLVALLAILTGRHSSPKPEPIFGRKNVVLFVTHNQRGLSNIHLATTFTLAERHPEIEVHYASFKRLAPEVARISAAAAASNSAAKPVVWHELPGLDLVEVGTRIWGNVLGIITPPGLRGLNKCLRDAQRFIAPWDVEEHWAIYQEVVRLIEEIDPAVVVVDSILRPAVEATRDLNRKHLTLFPSTLSDPLAYKQPWGAMFWKYPPVGSGHPYPVPWRLIPKNIYHQVRLIYAILVAPDIKAKRKALSEKGIKQPLDCLNPHQPGVPWLSFSFPEASFPMAILPEGTLHCGPIVLQTAPIEQQDPELAQWLSNAPTMLVILGSGMRYDETRASIMVEAFLPVLEQTNMQILWKMQKVSPFDDSFLKPVEKYVAEGRLRIEGWLKADPTTILETGHISAFVHHGGGNCYHEAIYAGVPQVILPLWFDLYNFAALAEYLGVGIWPGKETAPDWEAKSLSQGFLQALTGDVSKSMREKATALAKIARQYEGRYMAAREISKLAELGHS